MCVCVHGCVHDKNNIKKLTTLFHFFFFLNQQFVQPKQTLANPHCSESQARFTTTTIQPETRWLQKTAILGMLMQEMGGLRFV